MDDKILKIMQEGLHIILAIYIIIILIYHLP